MASQPDPFDELRVRLQATQEAAERIAQQVPPQGWATPRDGDAMADDVRALMAVLHGLRDVLPEDLLEQAREAIRQLLLLLRAILDLVVARLDEPEAESGARRATRSADSADSSSVGPQDIPIA
jgi:hypothetical protein